MCFQVCVQYSMSPHKNFQANHCDVDYFYSLHPALPGPAQCKSWENITNHKANSEFPRTLPTQLSPFFLTDWDPWLTTVWLGQRIDCEISVPLLPSPRLTLTLTTVIKITFQRCYFLNFTDEEKEAWGDQSVHQGCPENPWPGLWTREGASETTAGLWLSAIKKIQEKTNSWRMYTGLNIAMEFSRRCSSISSKSFPEDRARDSDEDRADNWAPDQVSELRLLPLCSDTRLQPPERSDASDGGVAGNSRASQCTAGFCRNLSF